MTGGVAVGTDARKPEEMMSMSEDVYTPISERSLATASIAWEERVGSRSSIQIPGSSGEYDNIGVGGGSEVSSPSDDMVRLPPEVKVTGRKVSVVVAMKESSQGSVVIPMLIDFPWVCNVGQFVLKGRVKTDDVGCCPYSFSHDDYV